MTQNLHAIIMGGVLPALFFGLAGVFAKPRTQAGIGTGFYLVCVGLAASLVAFAEWKDVHISKLIIGSVLVVIGGTLVENV